MKGWTPLNSWWWFVLFPQTELWCLCPGSVVWFAVFREGSREGSDTVGVPHGLAVFFLEETQRRVPRTKWVGLEVKI